jgi:hypothetical protein
MGDTYPDQLSRQSSSGAAAFAKLDIPISLPAIKTQPPVHLQMALNAQETRPKFVHTGHNPSQSLSGRLMSVAEHAAHYTSKDMASMYADVSMMSYY